MMGFMDRKQKSYLSQVFLGGGLEFVGSSCTSLKRGQGCRVAG